MIALLRSIKEHFDLTKEEPRNVALGAAFGVFLGFVPLKCGLTALLIFIIGMTGTSGTVAVLVGLAMKTFSMLVADPAAWETGRSICESDFAKNHPGFFGLPVIALLGFDRYHVMGGTLLGLLATVPAFIVGYRIQKLVLKGREKVEAAIAALRKKKVDEAAAAGQPAPAEEEKKPGLFGKLWAFPAKKWVLLILALVAYDVFGAKPTMTWLLQKKFPDVLAIAMGVVGPDGKPLKRGEVSWDDATYQVSLLKGTVVMTNLQIANPRNTGENLFKAKTVDLEISMVSFLRRRFVIDKVALDTPELAVAREKDGSLSVEPEPAPDAPKVEPGTDWASRARSAFERIKKEHDERKKKQQEKTEEQKKTEKEGKKTAEQEAAHKRPQTLAEAEERAEDGIPGSNPLLASLPHWVVRKVELKGFKVNLVDPVGAQPGFAFKTGDLLEAAQDRRANEKATDVHLDGTLVSTAGKDVGTVQLDLSVAAPEDDAKPEGWKLHLVLANVELHDADALFANGVPLRFDQGKAAITIDATGHGVDGDLDGSPKIAFADVVAHARKPGETILGADAERVASAVTSKKNFELADVKVTGTLIAPKFEMGEAFRKILIDAGLDVAKAKIEEAAKPLIDKIEKKVPGVGEGTKKGLDDVMKKGTDLFGK